MSTAGAGIVITRWLWISEVAVKRLLLGWVTVCGQVNHLDVWSTTSNNSAFYPPLDFQVECQTTTDGGMVYVDLTLDLSSARIQMEALGHTLTTFCSVCRQFLGFIPSSVHVLQISSDDVHPVFPWPSRLSLHCYSYVLRVLGLMPR